jgi:hypothetical protein
MKRKTKSAKALSGMAPVHPNAAAIDIGATMHVAAVSADRSTPPVRTFGAFTNDLHRLADWFAECGARPSSWSRPAFIGFRFLSCSTSVALKCSSSMLAMPSMFPAVKRM